MPGRFVAVPASELVAAITSISEAVARNGGMYGDFTQGRERVFTLTPPNRDMEVRIFSSLGVNNIQVRECGTDSVKIVWGYTTKSAGDCYAVFKPLAKSQRIYRTAPRRALGESARVEAFLDRLRDAIREAYREAVRVPKCPVCSAAERKSVLVSKHGSRGPFVGCSAYPRCTFTRDVPREAVR